MRKLTTIRKIKKLLPIPNADRIELAVVDGWQTVVGKNQFKEGDYCVYFEIDSLLPFEERFSVVKNTKKVFDETFYFLKTARFLGQISQGFVMTLDQLPEIKEAIQGDPEKFLNHDFSEILGVTKYEPPEDLALNTEILGDYPSFISRSSEMRIQNCFDEFKEKYKDVLFYPTLKMDGCSLTVCHVNNPVYFVGRNNYVKDLTEQTWVGSHNLVLKNPDDVVNDNVKENAFYKAVDKYNLREQIKNWTDKNKQEIAIQCELIGPKIARSHERFTEYDLRAFHVFLINKGRRATFSEFVEIMKDFDCPTVLEYEPIKVFSVFDSVDEILEFAEGHSENPDVVREGLVFRSDALNEFGHPVSFKAISNSYLLKKDKIKSDKKERKKKSLENQKKEI